MNELDKNIIKELVEILEKIKNRIFFEVMTIYKEKNLLFYINTENEPIRYFNINIYGLETVNPRIEIRFNLRSSKINDSLYIPQFVMLSPHYDASKSVAMRTIEKPQGTYNDIFVYQELSIHVQGGLEEFKEIFKKLEEMKKNE